MTNFHYCIPHDSDEFFKTIFPSAALRHEPLLNALVGFSAYHLTLQDPNGKLQDFLQYYNRSVTLLLGTLKRKEKHTVATLLTILQLATIEVRSDQAVRLSLLANICGRSIWVIGSTSWATRKQRSKSLLACSHLKRLCRLLWAACVSSGTPGLTTLLL